MTKKATATKKATSNPVPLTRQEMRDALLGQRHTPKTKRITLFGIEVDLQQATLGSILDVKVTDNPKKSSVDMIVKYACVPGTSDRVFEEADREMIEAWPFGDDVMELQNAIAELTGVDIRETEKELKDSPLEEQP